MRVEFESVEVPSNPMTLLIWLVEEGPAIEMDIAESSDDATDRGKDEEEDEGIVVVTGRA